MGGGGPVRFAEGTRIIARTDPTPENGGTQVFYPRLYRPPTVRGAGIPAPLYPTYLATLRRGQHPNEAITEADLHSPPLVQFVAHAVGSPQAVGICRKGCNVKPTSNPKIPQITEGQKRRRSPRSGRHLDDFRIRIAQDGP